jgi:5'-deoxynucleotidase YfbR-like HD superfamily hydrolase
MYTDPLFRDMMDVKRWAIVPTLRKQSIAEHQYLVMLYVMDICKITNTALSVPLLIYAALHDADELHSGDIPTPYKDPGTIYDRKGYAKRYKDKLTIKELDIVKLADMIEAVMFLIDELKSGNKKVLSILRKSSKEAIDFAGKLDMKEATSNIFDHAADYEGRIE